MLLGTDRAHVYLNNEFDHFLSGLINMRFGNYKHVSLMFWFCLSLFAKFLVGQLNMCLAVNIYLLYQRMEENIDWPLTIDPWSKPEQYLMIYSESLEMYTVFQDMEDYLKGCRFLPKLNNEIPSERNATYKERFSSLENLVLIMVRLA